MQKFITIFLLITTFNNLNAQIDEQILNEILFDLFNSEQDTILLKKEITKTYFEHDTISFENTTGFTVPANIIYEWKKNEENNGFNSIWNEQYLNKKDTIFYDKDTIIVKKPIFKCLMQNEIFQLFDKIQKRQKIYSISKILFDNSKENAIFHFTVLVWHGSFWTETVMIKKVFGKWVIITRFDFAMT